MNLLEHLDKNNLHHAYLIEGAREEIESEILEFFESSGMKTSGNPDFCHISTGSFKVEDARALKSMEQEKSFSAGLPAGAGRPAQAGRKIFLISADNFLLEAQNTLLKIFEEPIQNTHFFVVVPDAGILLKTFVSRFYVIKAKDGLEKELKEAEKFMAMPAGSRIDFLKELLAESSKEDTENLAIETSSARPKALKFLNALEAALHAKMSKCLFDMAVFQHIFKVREFLNQPGSSAKNLMESVALIVPNF